MTRYALFFLGLCTTTAALGAPADYNQAVRDYNEGRYPKALNEFQQLEGSYPNNSLVHYYLGLSLQATGQLQNAKSEFGVVANCSDPRLRSLAQSGLAQLSSVHTSAAVRRGTAVSTAFIPSSSPNGPSKVKKVFDFYADWCGPCHAFEPAFNAVQSQMSGVRFQRYNIDDPEGKELSSKYPFPTIPHVVFLDDHDNVLFSGSPNRDAESFKSQIDQFR